MTDGSNFLVFLRDSSDFVFYGKSSGTEYTKTLSGESPVSTVLSHADGEYFYVGFAIASFHIFFQIDTTTFSISN